MLCEYDCGSPAKFKTKGGKNICKPSPNACPANKKKNSVGLKDAYKDGKFEKRIVPEESRKRMAVNKGLTSATSERVKRSRETWKKVWQKGNFSLLFLVENILLRVNRKCLKVLKKVITGM